VKNVIYTGNFSINWDYFKGTQSWQIYNLYHIQKYCERHNAELKIIDNSNKWLSDTHSYIREKSNYKADSWSIATWCSVAAIRDFVYSDYDYFGWIDLDICIIKPELNIFDYLTGDFMIDHGDAPDGGIGFKKKFIESMTVFPYKKNCSTAIIVANKQGCMDIYNRLLNLGLDPADHKFLDRLIELFKNDKGFICDEGLVEVGLNSSAYTKFQQWPEELRGEVITATSHRDFTKDCFSYHFASHTKDLIPGFWKEREVY
jgi:hypothetical protein